MQRVQKHRVLVFAVVFISLMSIPYVAYTAKPGSSILRVHFIDVGKGDSILIENGDKAVLIDGGTHTMGPKVVNYVMLQGIEHIDMVIATHPHNDHIGGLTQVLDAFSVGEVLDSGMDNLSSESYFFSKVVEEHNIPRTHGRAGVSRELAEGVSFEILHPDSLSFSEINDLSLVIKLTYGQIRFLFTGDIEAPAIKEILSRGHDLRSDILKISNHGSKEGTSMPFLKAVSPEIGIVCVGIADSSGLPDKKTLERLSRRGVHVYRTDLHGNIVVTTDGKTYSVQTSRTPTSAL